MDLSAVRQQYYDRSMAQRAQQSSQNAIAPHGSTLRWTYTVPAGKKAILRTVFCRIIRDTAAAPVGRAIAAVEYTPIAATSIQVAIAQVNTNGVNDIDKVHLGCEVALLAGDAVDGYDNDQSTGGTMSFLEAATIEEFDA